MVIIDTDVLVWMLRGRQDLVEAFRRTVLASKGFVYVTAVQVAEIFSGARGNEVLKTREFLESLLTVPLDYAIGEEAGTFMGQFGTTHGITLTDALTASAARKNALKL